MISRRAFTSPNGLFAILLLGYAAYALAVVIPTGGFLVDEAWTAVRAAEMLRGKVLYQEVSAPYGPLSFGLYALIFGVFGKSFYVLRVAGMVVILCQACLLRSISRRLGLSGYALLFAPLLLLAGLGLFQGCRLSASLLGGLATLIALDCHLGFLATGKRHYLWGLGCALLGSLLAKHNIFVFDALAHGALALWSSWQHWRARRTIGWADLLPVPVVVAVGAAVWLIRVRSFLPIVYDDLFGHIAGYSEFMRIPPPGLRLLVRPWGDSSVFAWAYFGVIGLLFLVAGAGVRWARTGALDRQTVLLALVCLLQFFQVYPLTDYSHFARATVAVPALVAALLFRPRLRLHWMIGGAAAAVAIALVMPALQNQPDSLRRVRSTALSALPYNGGVRADPDEKTISTILAIAEKLAGGSLIVVGGHAEYLEFGANMVHPTRQMSISPYYVHSAAEEAEIVADSDRAGVRLVVVAPPIAVTEKQADYDAMPIIHDWIGREFSPAGEVGQYRLFLRGR